MKQVETTKKMKAVICLKYGSPKVLTLKEVERPIPKDDQVLVRNYGSSINTVDVVCRGGKAPKGIFWPARTLIGLGVRLSMGGLRRPSKRTPGFGFAGEIVSVGRTVTGWQVGDQVYGYNPPGGAYAEYMAVTANILANKPANISFQEAAAVPGGASPALVAFRDVARPKKGQKVLVIGASGGIGTFGVQIAKLYGAEVTGVCGPTNIEMVQEIGADFAIDYTKEDYTKSGQNKYNIIFDAIGANTFSRCRNILADGGLYVTNNPLIRPSNLFRISNPKFKVVEADEGAGTLNLLREWIESEKLKPVIDTVYPLSQTAEAHRHYETGHAKGRVVISIE